MDRLSLEFQGVNSAPIPLALLVTVSLVLIAFGVYRLAQRRVREGLISLFGAMGAAALTATLVVDVAVQRVKGNRHGAAGSALAATAAGIATAMAAAFALAAGSAPAWWMALLAVQIAVAVGVFYSALYAHLGRWRLVSLMALRCAAIAMLMLVLFKPALHVRPSQQAATGYLPILVDRSGSMATVDEVNLPDRYAQAIGTLAFQSRRLGREFRCLWYGFAGSAQRCDSLEGLASAGPREELEGMLLVTDGIHNAPDNVMDAVEEAGVPIHTVAVGSPSEMLAGQRNIRLASVSAPFEVIRNNVATITADVKMTAAAMIPAEIRLSQARALQPVDTRPLWTDKNDTTLKVELKWTPSDRGGADAGADVRALRIVIPPDSTETLARDNSAELHVLVIEPRIRVLYIEGTIRPEYKFLKRLLETDTNVRLMALVRISGSRFLAQGSVDGRKLSALPQDDEDLGLFDVIILGDLDRTFLSDEQMAAIRRFVNDGGGLVMLGGHNSFGPGGYGGTDIEHILPVTVGSRSQPQETTAFGMQLTASGEVHPIFEGLIDFFAGPSGRRPKRALPELRGCVTLVGAKSGASVLALHPSRRNETGPLVVMAAQRFGAGRSIAFAGDTTWQWYLPMRGMGAESPYNRMWGQMIRWLAHADTKARDASGAVVGRIDSGYIRVGDDLKITALVRDEQGRSDETMQVLCAVDAADGGEGGQTVPLSPISGAGLFEGTFRPQREGDYRLRFSAADAAGQTLGTDELPLTVGPHRPETDRLARDDALLRSIADRSGGRFANISALPDLIDKIIDRRRSRSVPAGTGKLLRLYNFPLLFMATATVLTAEWMLRRRWQLH